MKLKRFVIVGAGSLGTEDLKKYIQPEDFICAADAGYLYLKEAGIRPDLLVGDFDSAAKPEDETGFQEMIVLPVVKDDTDIVFCVKEGFKRDFKDFLILGGLGGDRLSHTMANIQLLSMISAMGGRGELKFKNISAFLIREKETKAFSDTMRGSISLFSLSETAQVSIEGLYYTLDHGSLTRDFPLGVSNEFIGREAFVTVHTGEVLCITEEAQGPGDPEQRP